MTGQASEIQWYIARDGKQHGPLTEIEMRTFVAHSYLRTSDLIWRPGMAEWLAAPIVFPTAFEAQGEAQTAAPRAASYHAPAPAYTPQPSKPAATAPRDAHSSDFDAAPEPRPERSIVKRLALASVAITVIGGGALAVASYRQPLMNMVSGSSSATDVPPPVVSAPTQMKVAGPPPTAEPTAADVASASPAPQTGSQTTTSSVSSGGPSGSSDPSDAPSSAPQNAPNQQVAAIDATPPAPPPPPTIDGSPIDAKLQKVPVWALIKKEYPDWYSTQVTAANKLVADKKSDNDVAMLLAQGLVNLRRQNSEKALEASSEKLQQVAVAFLDHLKSLRSQSVSACFGFISKGETSPAVVQMMENPESATALNAQADAVFEAISEGNRNPVKHDSAVKSDYDILIKELSKLGWKEEDLQVFSNPKLLAKREPEQVCKMVQEWFVAHLAVPDKAVRDRLLFETLKPVVSG